MMETNGEYFISCRELFQVKAKLDPSNQGYTSDALGLHTDLAYFWNPPFVRRLPSLSSHFGGSYKIADVIESHSLEPPENFTASTCRQDSAVEAVLFQQGERPRFAVLSAYWRCTWRKK